ncbi:ENTH-domain-containing protein [Tothia fuscella]|uniref:ENTH-domain-containing protein n=1 Tax=Tothia fuscella TaxID=1048955 RepID=A0A9P4TXP3_9PEZI|nr:ENTH-domain-containing protein [Tothia fuscella]
MQEIASATFNYQLLNEIMPMIYKRFTEKAADEWRQIYKGLQLLEFLIKNGSERVIDDARSHLSLLKMLRQFHFIDMNGKDQGINVRNRSKELVELLSDVDKIRTERKKARSNRQKYGGYEGGGGGGLGAGMSSGRMGGVGSESGGASGYGQYNGQVYGDGGGFGGQTSDYQDTGAGGTSSTPRRGDKFEEYDEYDEGTGAAPARRKSNSISTTSPSTTRRGKAAAPPPKPKEPEEDLFDFGDEPVIAKPSNGKAPATSNFNVLDSTPADDDDDFDDFQSAAPPAPSGPTTSNFTIGAIAPPASTSTTTPATQFAAPQPRSAAQGASLNGLFATVSPTPAQSQQQRATSITSSAPSFSPVPQTSFQPAGPNYFQSVSVASPASSAGGNATPTSMASLGRPSGQVKKPTSSAGGDAFASLLGGAGGAKKGAAVGKGPTMADLAKQKTQQGIWGSGSAGGSPAAGASSQGAKPSAKSGGAFDDLLG